LNRTLLNSTRSMLKHKAFGSSILLRNAWNGQLMSDPVFREMIFERTRQIFTTIIRSEGPHFASSVIFHSFLPYLEIIQNFRLHFRAKYIGQFRMIIRECHKIVRTSHRWHLHWTANIIKTFDLEACPSRMEAHFLLERALYKPNFYHRLPACTCKKT
jgi:hypothetical protein